jgi:hypothetical protein
MFTCGKAPKRPERMLDGKPPNLLPSSHE